MAVLQHDLLVVHLDDLERPADRRLQPDVEVGDLSGRQLVGETVFGPERRLHLTPHRRADGGDRLLGHARAVFALDGLGHLDGQRLEERFPAEVAGLGLVEAGEPQSGRAGVGVDVVADVSFDVEDDAHRRAALGLEPGPELTGHRRRDHQAPAVRLAGVRSASRLVETHPAPDVVHRDDRPARAPVQAHPDGGAGVLDGVRQDLGERQDRPVHVLARAGVTGEVVAHLPSQSGGVVVRGGEDPVHAPLIGPHPVRLEPTQTNTVGDLRRRRPRRPGWDRPGSSGRPRWRSALL